MFPISIISPHDFKTNPARAIRTSRDLGTRSDELDTLLFQSNVEEFTESFNRIGKETNINTIPFPTLLTETKRIEQDLLQQLASINNHRRKHSEAYERADQLLRHEELSNLESICDRFTLSFAFQEDERITLEQKTDEEILNHCRPEANTIESSRENSEVESSDRPATQNNINHEKQETNSISDPMVDPVADREGTEDNDGVKVMKLKRKKPKKIKKKIKKNKSKIILDPIVDTVSKGGSVEQITIEQKTDEEILNHCRPEANTFESSRENSEVESSDRPATQNNNNHEKQETNSISDPIVDLVADREGTEDNDGVKVTKLKRKKPKKKQKKKKNSKSLEDSSTTTSLVEEKKISNSMEDSRITTTLVGIFGTMMAFNVTKEEEEIVNILNFYTEKSVEEFDDVERYITFLEYHCYIITILIKKPDGLASLSSKFDRISSTVFTHQFFSVNHHFYQAVLYCIILTRRASEKHKLQQYFNRFIEDNNHQKYNEAMLSESNDTIIDYFRIMAEDASLHPVKWYTSLKEVSLEIQKIRSFPGIRPARSHWTDTIMYCATCDEAMPYDPSYRSMILDYVEGEEEYRKAAWYHWLNTRRLPWNDAISAYELNQTMESDPSP